MRIGRHGYGRRSPKVDNLGRDIIRLAFPDQGDLSKDTWGIGDHGVLGSRSDWESREYWGKVVLGNHGVLGKKGVFGSHGVLGGR